jgi:2-keto-3-deoxy-L-rhamnonate aldolase RhmA
LTVQFADNLQAFGVRLVTNPQVVQLAKNAGFDSLFIDLEHSSLSVDDASKLCCAGLSLGTTPFVRVPHQSGNGFVQKVLDGGAMGVIFPHVQSAGMQLVLRLKPTFANNSIFQRKPKRL